MREPVSTKQVAIMVSEPPSSILRAAPKNLFGGYSADGSMPPDKVLPEGVTTKLYALAKRVMESINITTSRPVSTMRFARSKAISATLTWEVTGSSKVDEITSASPERAHQG